MSRPEFTIFVRGRKVHLGQRTILMGVLNVTPDSFSDGGRYLNPRRAIRHACEMVSQGADWVDVGGESTRPGAAPISAAEELRRVLPVIEGIRQQLPALPISIDTTKAEVAEKALRAGASIVNDVSGLRFDARIADVVCRHHALLILMHMRGRPETMQRGPFARSISRSLSRSLRASIDRALRFGVRHSQLIIDPGLGFGKTRRQNFEILARPACLHRFRLPIMIGASRKSFIQAVVAGEALDPARSDGRYWRLTQPIRGGSIAWRAAPFVSSNRNRHAAPALLDFGDAGAATAAVLAGTHILRVHRVDAVLAAVRIADAILAAH